MEKMYQVKDIARLLGLAPETVYRKVKAGEIPAIRVGGGLRFPTSLFEEWMKQKGGERTDRWRHHLHRFMKLLRERWGEQLKSIVLFGSFARKVERPASDIDLLVVVDGLPKSRLDRQAVIFELAKKISPAFAHKLSAIALTPEEAKEPKPLYLGLLSAHESLWDPEGFFQERMKEVRDALKKANAEQNADPSGVPYWVLHNSQEMA